MRAGGGDEHSASSPAGLCTRPRLKGTWGKGGDLPLVEAQPDGLASGPGRSGKRISGLRPLLRAHGGPAVGGLGMKHSTWKAQEAGRGVGGDKAGADGGHGDDLPHFQCERFTHVTFRAWSNSNHRSYRGPKARGLGTAVSRASVPPSVLIHISETAPRHPRWNGAQPA